MSNSKHAILQVASKFHTASYVKLRRAILQVTSKYHTFWCVRHAILQVTSKYHTVYINYKFGILKLNKYN